MKVWVWDVASGHEVFSAKGGGHGVAFSPDGKRLASGGKLWDTETGQELLSLPGDAYGIAFSLEAMNVSRLPYWRLIANDSGRWLQADVLKPANRLLALLSSDRNR
jgi:WD40 repeat protein